MKGGGISTIKGNIGCGGELMGVDMLLLDSQVCSVPPLEFVTALTIVKKDEDVKVIVAGDDDWLPPSPKVVFDESKELGGESTIKAVRKPRFLLAMKLKYLKTFSEAAAAQVDLRSLEL
ncbi:hypothetical protein HID58_029136 [Brassica napus]|uniref:Uncharacterized protein n=2 Tax=Brassica napus TaxID=3708 RepID=A0ABQ8CC87_BRANA|nr:hypothetical protein HID58_029136 [Brassica napus]